jgi:hypothetical protein
MMAGTAVHAPTYDDYVTSDAEARLLARGFVGKG